MKGYIHIVPLDELSQYLILIIRQNGVQGYWLKTILFLHVLTQSLILLSAYKQKQYGFILHLTLIIKGKIESKLKNVLSTVLTEQVNCQAKKLIKI